MILKIFLFISIVTLANSKSKPTSKVKITSTTMATTTLKRNELKKPNFYEVFVKSSNDFAADLYQKVVDGEKGNVVISATSVQCALSLAMFGARGETQQQMKSGMKYPLSLTMNDIGESFKTFTKMVRKTKSLKIANKLYVSDNVTIKKLFKDVATQNFAAEVQTLNFSDNVRAAETMNNWVMNKTNNLIKDFIDSSYLNEKTKMIIINAVYFKGLWEIPFNRNDTEEGTFYLADETPLNVNFMRKFSEEFKYGTNSFLGAEVIELQYTEPGFSMVLILPFENVGLAALETRLASYNFNKITSKLSLQPVSVIIPRFKLEFSVNLNGPLIRMGMMRMFDRDFAEFEEMFEDGKRINPEISKVLQKAVIIVNEEGTEAAAATGIVVTSVPPMFKADRPFIFMLRGVNQTLFMGRVGLQKDFVPEE